MNDDTERLRTERDHARMMLAQAMGDKAVADMLMQKLIEQHDDVIQAKNVLIFKLYDTKRRLEHENNGLLTVIEAQEETIRKLRAEIAAMKPADRPTDDDGWIMPGAMPRGVR